MLLARQQTRRSANPLCAAIDAGGYDVLRLLYEFPSRSLNIYEFLQVAQPFGPRYFLDSADGFHLQEDVTKPMTFVSLRPDASVPLGTAGDEARHKDLRP